MRITVRLLASYRQYLPEDPARQGHPGLPRAGSPEIGLEVAPGTTVRQVLRDLPIPPADRCTFFVNGLHGRRDQVLEEGDVLTVFPAVGGG